MKSSQSSLCSHSAQSSSSNLYYYKLALALLVALVAWAVLRARLEEVLAAPPEFVHAYRAFGGLSSAHQHKKRTGRSPRRASRGRVLHCSALRAGDLLLFNHAIKRPFGEAYQSAVLCLGDSLVLGISRGRARVMDVRAKLHGSRRACALRRLVRPVTYISTSSFVPGAALHAPFPSPPFSSLPFSSLPSPLPSTLPSTPLPSTPSPELPLRARTRASSASVQAALRAAAATRDGQTMRLAAFVCDKLREAWTPSNAPLSTAPLSTAPRSTAPRSPASTTARKTLPSAFPAPRTNCVCSTLILQTLFDAGLVGTPPLQKSPDELLFEGADAHVPVARRWTLAWSHGAFWTLPEDVQVDLSKDASLG